MRYGSKSARHAARAAFTSLALLSIGGAFGQTAAVTGGITGTVETTDGKGVGRANVAIRVRPPAALGKPVIFNTDVVTANDGSFSVSAVPNGVYAVCPDPRSDKLVTPCDWEAEPTVIVAGGKITAMKPIVLKAGVDLWVHVDDPQGKRSSQEGKVPGATLLLMVRLPGGRQFPIPQTVANASGFDHHITVPTGTDLILTAFSGAFAIANTANATSAVAGSPQGVATTLNFPVGTTQHKEVITVH